MSSIQCYVIHTMLCHPYNAMSSIQCYVIVLVQPVDNKHGSCGGCGQSMDIYIRSPNLCCSRYGSAVLSQDIT